MNPAETLLDVNVLIAMAWPSHTEHAKVQRWLAKRAFLSWATCPFTEAAFVRIVSNPAFSVHALTPSDAFALLRSNLAHAAHRFWPDQISLEDATSPFQSRIAGHQQVTDAYLLGLAAHKKAKLATLDSGVASLLPERDRGRELLILI